jgi:predicted ATP-grasp superfamily ATP-dependent carboligase
MVKGNGTREARRGEHWVLVSDGADAGTRDCVVAIRALAEAGYKVAVTVRSERPLLSRHVSRTVPADTEDLGGLIEREMSSGEYDAFIPASETVVLAMKAQVPMLLDKAKTTRRAREVGIPVPDETVFENASQLLAAAPDLRYPVVVKPAVRTFKAFRADSAAELAAVPADAGELIVQPFLDGQMSAIAGVMWDSRMHSSTTERWERIWPLDCGLAAWAVTTSGSDRLANALAELMAGYSGLFVAQFVDGHLIDLNLRVHSSLPLAVKAGANLAAIYADLAHGLFPRPRQAEPGHTFRWISGDVKGTVASLRSGAMTLSEAVHHLSPVGGTVHSIFSWNDPAPMLARLGSRLAPRPDRPGT